MSEIDDLRAENERLKKWRTDVTAALQNPGGAFYEDVPKLIAQLRRELAEAAMEIDCAGPVAHRIRKLKLELSTEITLLRCELAEARGKLQIAIDMLDIIDDRSLDELDQGAKNGTYLGDRFNAPDDCETLVTVTRGELRTCLKTIKQGK
jgi:hypothetical protein